MQVTVFGPNLSGQAQRKGYNHVHLASCQDCKHYGPGKKFGGEDNGYTIEAQSRRDIVEFLYPSGDFGYDPDTEWESYDDLYLAPCVKLPKQASLAAQLPKAEPAPKSKPKHGYRAAIEFIATQDEPGDMDIDNIEAYISTITVAVSFGRTEQEVAKAILKYRERHGA